MPALSELIPMLLFVGIIFLVWRSQRNRRDRIRNANQQLHDNYRTALQGHDKQAALAAGRAYYGALRYPKALTLYDEQAIANDLSAMKSGQSAS